MINNVLYNHNRNISNEQKGKGQDAGRIREECRPSYDSLCISGKVQGEFVMFARKKCRPLSVPYFRCIRQTDNFYEIQSQNTGRFRIIQKLQIVQQNSIIIYHKHTKKTPYYKRVPDERPAEAISH